MLAPFFALLAHLAERRFGTAESADRSRGRAPRATSPTAETMRLERIQSEFESPVAYHFARVAQRQRQRLQTPLSACSNHAARTNAAVAQPAEARGLNPLQVRDRGPPAVPIHAPCSRPLRQMGRHRSYTPTSTVFDPRKGYGSLAQRQSARPTCERRQDHPLQDPPLQSLSSIAERAADNRDTAGQNRQGLPIGCQAYSRMVRHGTFNPAAGGS